MPYAFTAAQLVDIRRFCGYPALAQGVIQFPALLINPEYPLLEVRMQGLSAEEGAVVVNTYLTNLTALETAIVTAAGNLDTDQAAVWIRNKSEIADRTALFADWRRRLCAFLGVQPGPEFIGGRGNSISLVV